MVTACYLARAGLDVLALEQSAKLGGGSRAEELVPGYRFNTHSAAHNIINANGIVEELGLSAVGLEYREMDPFSRLGPAPASGVGCPPGRGLLGRRWPATAVRWGWCSCCCRPTGGFGMRSTWSRLR